MAQGDDRRDKPGLSTEMLYDPIRLAEETERVVVKGILKKYSRKAWSGKWYGSIASAFCCGYCLRWVVCWSGFPRDNPQSIGEFYSPEDILAGLVACAQKHLFRISELVDQTPYTSILETNGILIGYDINYAQQLSRFKRVHVMVSLKGTNPDEF